MTRGIAKLGIFVCAVIVLAGCGVQEPAAATEEPTAEPEAEATGTIVLADISDNPSRIIERFQPMADYLAANLGEFGIGVGEVNVAPDLETMVEWMDAGEVDLYFDSLYPALIVSDQSGAQPILRRWRDDVGEYHAVFFALADSDFESLSDLQGQVIAYDEPSSTSGYMLPTAYLLEAGLNPVGKSQPDSAVGEDEVGYAFSGDDENTVQWVVSGLAAAGVVDNVTYQEIPEETREGLIILDETEDIPRQVALVRSGLDEALVDAIKALLVGLEDTEEGLEILDTSSTTRFDEFPEGADAALDRMRELYDLVHER